LLDLHQNNLNQLPSEIGRLTKLEYLYLGENNLSQLPPEIGDLSDLTILDLKQKRLSQCPAEIGQLTDLATLVLNNNRLGQLPPEIGQLINLSTLSLSENSLSYLPAEIGQLTNLKTLFLSENSLNQLPPEIGDLANLITFFLSENELNQLPAEIGKLEKLKRLSLNQNNLKQLPPEIGKLTNLTLLTLSENNLNQLPPEINHLTNLKRVTFDDNPDLPISHELLHRDSYQHQVIPNLLPVEEPEFEWDNANALHFAYHYPVLSYRIFHRFVMDQHVRIYENILWRTGVMLKHEGLQALIKAHIEDSVISIAINGAGRRREFLTNLRFIFDNLHESIPDIQPKAVVPIPGHLEVEPVPYLYLLHLEEKGVDNQLFPGMDDFVNVKWLLDGVESPAMRQLSHKELREILHSKFDKRELQELLLDLDINPNDLNDETGGMLAMELVSYMDRRGRTMELVEAVRGKRPFLFE